VFKAVGLQAMIGRTFTADEDRAPRHASRSSASASGGRLDTPPHPDRQVDHAHGEPHVVVGVMPAGMRFPSTHDRRVAAHRPLRLDISSRDRGAHPGLFAVARLKTGIGVARASADMDAIARASSGKMPRCRTPITRSR
jgi:hypothetical protein